MKICLTGSTGFVGGALCNHLLNNTYQVIASVRNLNLAVLPHHKNLYFVYVQDREINKNYSEALNNVDVVIHCAARAHVSQEKKRDTLHLYRKTNVQDTLNLAKQAADHGVKRFIFLSSIKVNGEQTSLSDGFKYDDTPKPEDAYGISKLEAEEALIEISKRTGMEVVIIRAPLVYGEGVKGNFYRLLDLCNKGMPLPLANTNNFRSMISIDNLIDFIMLCVLHDRAAGKIFLVSDDECISTTELIKKIKKIMTKPIRLFPLPFSILKFFSSLIGKSSEVDKLFNSLIVDTSYTREILGWKPKYSLESGLKKTVNWYLKNL